LVIPREAPIICAKRIKKPGASHNIAARAQASPREREHHRASANITARARTSPREREHHRASANITALVSRG
jgi:hypothetical protein